MNSISPGWIDVRDAQMETIDTFPGTVPDIWYVARFASFHSLVHRISAGPPSSARRCGLAVSPTQPIIQLSATLISLRPWHGSDIAELCHFLTDNAKVGFHTSASRHSFQNFS